MMTVYWLTCRSLSDLCSTTHQALLGGLVDRGCNVVLLNADPSMDHDGAPWSHVHVPNSTLPGQSARSMAKHMRRWVKKHAFEKEAVVVMDWRVAPRLTPVLFQRNIAWAVLDRSPPAYSGWLASLQWPSWRRSWRQVAKYSHGLGFVVSKSHSRLVERQTGTPVEKMRILPAGVNVDLFQPGVRRSRLTLIYHGRLDKNRGVLALPMLLQKARQEQLDVDLVMVGDGDAVAGLNRIAKDMKGLELHPTMSQNELAKLLSTCHVGLLPMPKTEIWSIASPLKQCEYAASGLAMLGIDHQGHRLRGHHQTSWLKLVAQEDFFDDGVQWLKHLQAGSMHGVMDAARSVAVRELSWEAPVNTLHSALLELATTSS